MKHFRQRIRVHFRQFKQNKTKTRYNVLCSSEQWRECFTGKVGNTIDTPALCQCSLGALASKLGIFWVSQPQNECILGTPDIKPGVYPTFLSEVLEIYPTSLSELKCLKCTLLLCVKYLKYILLLCLKCLKCPFLTRSA